MENHSQVSIIEIPKSISSDYKIYKCQQEGHQSEDANLMCIDIKCFKNNQQLDNMCLECNDNNVHNIEGHKHKSVKRVVNQILEYYHASNGQLDENLMQDKQQLVGNLQKLNQSLNILINYSKQMINNIEELIASLSYDNTIFQNSVNKLSQPSNQEEFQETLQQLKKILMFNENEKIQEVSLEFIGSPNINQELDNLQSMVENFEEEIIKKNLDKFKSFEKIKNLIPTDSDFSNYEKGEELRNESKWEDAIKYYNFQLLFTPDNAQTHFQKGYCLQKLQKYQEAILAFKQSLNKDLEDSNVYVNISHCYILLHLYQLGLDACIEGLKLNPQQKVLWNNKASALIKLGRLEDALEAIEKHLEIDPENEYLLSYKQKISQKMEQRNSQESKGKNQ